MQKPGFLSKLSTRVLWHANRTPAAGVIKLLLRFYHRSEVARRRKLKSELSPSAAELNLAKNLNDNGFILLDGVVDGALLHAMAAHAESKHRRAEELRSRQDSTHKSFWVRLLDEDLHDGKFGSDHPFVRFATQRPVINVIASALGEIPQLSDVLLTLSEETNEELAYSQLWHRDYDDTRTIKLFVYLTDVPSTDFGPFTFIPGPASDRFGLSVKSHMSDEKVFGLLARNDVTEMIAPRLTVFIVETSRCLHMGSRIAAGRQRLLYTATYVTVPRPYREPPPRFIRESSLDSLTTAILGRN